MSYTVRVRQRARRDLEDATFWYETQSPGLGSDFLDEVELAFNRVADDPYHYRVLHRETRRVLLQRFPFGVFFRVQRETIVIIAILHSSRDPNRWMQRA